MKKALIFLFIFFLIFSAAAGQEDEKTEQMLEEIESFWDGIDTFTCRFVQKKRLFLFEDEIISSGTLTYKKPGFLLWRYDPPDNSIVSFVPGRLTLYFPDLKKAKVIHLTEGEVFENPLSAGVGGGTKELSEDFSITLMEEGGVVTLVLIPTDSEEKQRIEKIEIAFDVDRTPKKTIIYEPGGDTTSLVFSKKEINVPVDDDLFEILFPPDTEVEVITPPPSTPEK
jgi:outer membrane lipoprotein-sorting protein